VTTSKEVRDINLEVLDHECLIESLAARRNLIGISQLGIARIMGVDEHLVYKVENETHDPKLSLLQNYAKALGGHLEISFVSLNNPRWE